LPDEYITKDDAWRPLRIRITEIRREPLHAITEADAIAEGYPLQGEWRSDMIGRLTETTPASPIQWYKSLWQQINGNKSWYDNPDVWVLSFTIEWSPSL
jgi:hypothetical protein